MRDLTCKGLHSVAPYGEYLFLSGYIYIYMLSGWCCVICVCVCVCVCAGVRACVCVCVWICKHTCMYLCIYICIYIYA